MYLFFNCFYLSGGRMQKRFISTLFAGLLAAILPSIAFANFHLMKVVEVFPGSAAAPNAQYVVIQMFAGGQNVVNGHKITVFDNVGVLTNTFTFTANVASGANQSKILIATTEAAALFGISANLTMTPVINPAGGKVCFDSLPVSCVAWGNYSKPGGDTTVGTPITQNGSGLLLGSAIARRLNISGGATNLDSGDDTSNSANDFRFVKPAPKNNAGNVGVAAGTCGNGILDAAESCDDNNTTAGDGCNAQCVLEFCGDVLDNNGVTETCDDGNLINTDACTNLCRLPACGDSFIQAGETCDDGNQSNNDGCSSICSVEIVVTCGNNTIDVGETCDDSNVISNDGCSSICRLEICGDNITQTNEECDDGNTTANDGCSATCENEICGDGITNNTEQCDDGNAVNNDECNNLCLLNFCGDSAINNGEACDDGNEDANDGCDPGCFEELCGDGVTQSDPNRPEACDDGNAINTDDCKNDCTNAACGDGAVQAGLEDCDDGNFINGDGCEDDCTLTQPEPEPSGGICAVDATSSSTLASLAGLFALFAFALFLRRRQ
jgi:cysteine-rich repeat protein